MQFSSCRGRAGPSDISWLLALPLRRPLSRNDCPAGLLEEHSFPSGSVQWQAMFETIFGRRQYTSIHFVRSFLPCLPSYSATSLPCPTNEADNLSPALPETTNIYQFRLSLQCIPIKPILILLIPCPESSLSRLGHIVKMIPRFVCHLTLYLVITWRGCSLANVSTGVSG